MGSAASACTYQPIIDDGEIRLFNLESNSDSDSSLERPLKPLDLVIMTLR